jgi:hypothetical protein
MYRYRQVILQVHVSSKYETGTKFRFYARILVL